MVEMMVIVYLTLMNGAVVPYKVNDEWPTVTAENGNEGIKKCQAKIDEIVAEMREDFKDHDPKPSTFMLGCAEKRE